MRLLILALLVFPLTARTAEFKNNIACDFTESLGTSFNEDTKNYEQTKTTNYLFQWNDQDDITDGGDMFRSSLIKEMWAMPIIGPGPIDQKAGFKILLMTFDDANGSTNTDELDVEADERGVAPPTKWERSYTRKNKDNLRILCNVNKPSSK